MRCASVVENWDCAADSRAHMLRSSRRGSQRHQRLHQRSGGGSFGTFSCAKHGRPLRGANPAGLRRQEVLARGFDHRHPRRHRYRFPSPCRLRPRAGGHGSVRIRRLRPPQPVVLLPTQRHWRPPWTTTPAPTREKSLEVQRTIADGDLVAVHSRVRHARGDSEIATVHIFRIADSLIVPVLGRGPGGARHLAKSARDVLSQPCGRSRWRRRTTSAVSSSGPCPGSEAGPANVPNCRSPASPRPGTM